MSRQGLLLCAWLALYPATQPAAHEIHLAQDLTQAVRLSLSYADGSPFAYESYELYPEDAQRPRQVGRTDARGGILFVPGEIEKWRIKSYSEDGHGIDRHFTTGTTHAQTSAVGDAQRWCSLFGGLGLLFGLFGLYQLFVRRKDHRA